MGCYIDVSVERKQKETLPAGACSRVKTITSSQDIKNYFLQLLVVLIQFPVSLFPELHMFRCRQLQVVFPSGCDLTVTVTSTQRQQELSHLKDLRLWQLDLVDKTSTQLYMRHTDLIPINQENISLSIYEKSSIESVSNMVGVLAPSLITTRPHLYLSSPESPRLQSCLL